MRIEAGGQNSAVRQRTLVHIEGTGKENYRMNADSMDVVLNVLQVFKSLGSALWIGSIFIWITIYYLLFKMFRLKFLKLLFVSELMGLVYWFWFHRYYFVGMQYPNSDSVAATYIFTVLDFILWMTPLCLSTIGAIWGLKYLRQLWREKFAEEEN